MKHPTKKKTTKKEQIEKDLVKPRLTIKEPNKEDVVLMCGMGSRYINHPGNLNYKNLVEKNLFNYKNRPLAERHAICRKIFNGITENGGRFIQIDLHKSDSLDDCLFFEKSYPDVQGQIMMRMRNAGKENLHVYHGRSPSQPQLPHANLSSILSQLFNDLTQEQLETFVTDPVIVNEMSRHLNRLAQALDLKQRFHFQPSLKPPSTTASDKPHRKCNPPTISSANETIDQKIEGVYEAYQEITNNIPSTKALLSPIKTTPASVTKTYTRNFFFDSGIIDSSSWSELLSRQMQGNDVKHILSIYAFDALSINKIISVRSKNSKTKRVFKCASCPKALNQGWSVQVVKIRNTDNLWAVTPFRGENVFTTNISCTCHKNQKGKVSDHLFLNSSLSRDFVSKKFWVTPGMINRDLVTIFTQRKDVHEQQLPSLSHRKEAIDFLVARELDKLRRRYHQFPAFLRTLLWDNGFIPSGFQNNSMVSVALQGTFGKEPNFHRVFVGFPIACLGQQVHIPVLFIDFYHYQCPQYDGKLGSLSSKLGDGSIVTLAIAIIPNEDTNNIAWFIQLCALHGIDFDCALFTDRGHIISAVRQLTLTTNLKFNLMFCLQHLKRNVWHKFPALKEPPMNEKVKTLLEKAAKAETSAKFLNSFFEFLSFVITTQGSTMAMDVAQYLLSIDPSHWTIMANNKRMFCSEIHSKHVNQLFHHLTAAVKLEQHLSPGNDDNGWIHDMDDMQLAQKILEFENMSVEDAPHVTRVLFKNFRKCPRYGENKNNVAESVGSKYLRNHVRERAPPDSLVLLLQNNNAMTYRHLQSMKSDPNKKSPLSVLMRTAHDHHNKQLDSNDFGRLNMGKENKGKPFIQCSVHSLDSKHCSRLYHPDSSAKCHSAESPEPTNHNEDLKVRNFHNMHDFQAQPLPNEVSSENESKNNDSSENVDSSKNNDSSRNNHSSEIFGHFFGKPLQSFPDNHPDFKPVPSGTPFIDSFNKPDIFLRPLFDFRDMNLNEEHLEQAFARDGNPTYAENSCGHSVCHEDVLTLKGTSWLNDKVIDLCFWALQQRDSKKLWNLQKRVATRNLFFRACFAVMLTTDTYMDYKNLAMWTKNADIFEQERLFFPVNINQSHWVCVVVYVKEQKIVVFDSMGNKHEKLVLLFFRFLCNEHRCKKKNHGTRVDPSCRTHASDAKKFL